MRIVLAMILAALIDVFFAAHAFETVGLYTGFLVLAAFRTRGAGEHRVLAGAFAYGLVLDVAHPALPFGALLTAHVVVAALLSAFVQRGSRAGARRTLVRLSLALASYAAFVEAVTYAVTSVAASTPAALDSAVLVRLAVSTLATASAAGFLLLVAYLFREHARRWLFAA